MKNIGGGSCCSQVVLVVVQWLDNSIQSNIVSGNAYMKLLYQALTISINVNDGSVAVFSYVRLWNYTAMHQLLLCSYIDRWAWVSHKVIWRASEIINSASNSCREAVFGPLSLCRVGFSAINVVKARALYMKVSYCPLKQLIMYV